jgi:hypothetical protein
MVEYLIILFNDTGFTTEMRNAWLSARTGRNIKFIDDLRYHEASAAIDDLKAIKENKK